MRRSVTSWPVVGSILLAGLMISVALLWSSELISSSLVQGGAAPAASLDRPTPTAPPPSSDHVSFAETPFIGDPQAPVAMAYWFDYQCPFCRQVELEVMPKLIEDYVKPGKLRIYFKDFQFLGPDSMAAAIAARAVWETAPDKFYAWHHAMFEHQDGENAGWGNAEDIATLTRTIDGIDATRVDQLIIDRAAPYKQRIDDSLSEGSTAGINGTPGTLIAGRLISGAEPYATFQAAIEAVLASPSR